MTNQVKAGRVYIGGGAPVSVQSMLAVPYTDVEGNVREARRLAAAGCEILRISVPCKEAVRLVYELKKAVAIPIVADIHFDYRMAIESAEAGADKIRINPGNIGGADRVRSVVQCCTRCGIPIRIGVNSGSCEKDLLEKYGGPTADALVESAMRHVGLLESFGFGDIVVSIKSSDVLTTIDGYRMLSKRTPHPLHVGVTEAGTYTMGLIKSAVGIGALLADGIGDTIRVSLTDDPIREVESGILLLRALGMRRGINVVSCPTCGRTAIDLIDIAKRVNDALAGLDGDLTVAVMGCVVNGPGEASAADIGIAGGQGCAVLFKRGGVVRKLTGDIAGQLIDEVKAMLAEKRER